MTGREIAAREEARRAGRPAASSSPPPSARREVLGWTPRKPELETMIADAWAWYQAHPDGYGD